MGRLQKRIDRPNLPTMPTNGKKLVLVVNDKADMGRSYYLPFAFIGQKTEDINLLFNYPELISLIVFTGGRDVDPDLYNESVGKKTYCDINRDKEEIEVFNQAMKHDIPMFGICRGLQFLTVMFGGKLIQHTEGHHTPHNMRTKDGIEFHVSSSHHQMCLPYKDDEIIGWASPKISKVYLDGNDKKMTTPEFEVEAVRFTKAKAVGVQYHPEIMNSGCYGFFYVEDLIRRYLTDVIS